MDCSPWGRKKSGTPEQLTLNINKLKKFSQFDIKTPIKNLNLST